MQYQEFLKKSGATNEEVPYSHYYYIEKAYMERDEMFPDQDSVISYFKEMGVRGFNPYLLDKVDELRKAISSLKRSSSVDNFDGMLKLALRAAKVS